jgi:hypothetical protein
MKNHHKHPTGATPLPEVHSVQNNKRFRRPSYGDPENILINTNSTRSKSQIICKRVILRPRMMLGGYPKNSDDSPNTRERESS